jgi:histidine triad (HIT) family protein
MSSTRTDTSFEAVTDCLFCKVVSGEADADEVMSTEHTYAFRDIDPAAPVHVLVVPRSHIADAAEVGSEHGGVLAEMFTTAQEVARREGVQQGGYRLVINVGEDALNSVGHLHMHVMGGRRMTWPPG